MPWLLRGLRLQLLVLVGLSAFAAWKLPGLTASFCARGREIVASGAFYVPLAISAAVALLGLLASARARSSPRGLLAVTFLCTGAGVTPLHWLAGKLLFPAALAEALTAEPSADVAFLGSPEHGLYSLLTQRDTFEELKNEYELTSWAALHPGGLLLADAVDLKGGAIPRGTELVIADRVHKTRVLLLRAERVGPAGSL